ncbi:MULTISPECIES: hypothetical protein [Metallosphaera]|uniref:hypothetical protein n=1 Tax=Metallosphaera TaxID=41980 RepID=UPI001F06D85E|nr:hypothetical protein [Metallosphaera sedula]MCH1770292.1 hypothetical protein [Metallosphaera sedula]MCP6727874.1 hypothetical protein [Metallosphaera sedula]
MTDLFSSQFFIVFFSVGVPLSIFFVLLFFFVLRPGRINFRRSTSTNSSAQSAIPSPLPSPIPPPPQQPTQTSTPQPQQDISKITSRVDKMEADLAKMISDTSTELRQSVENLGKNLEDLALAIKATKSDAESPFNLIQLNEQDPKTSRDSVDAKFTGLNIPNSSSSITQDISQNELPNINLKKLIQLSILLAILDYDKVKIRALLNLGLISPQDLEMISKIEDIIHKNRPKVDAAELALIAYDIAKSYNSVDSELVKFMSVLIGDGNGRRDNQ